MQVVLYISQFLFNLNIRSMFQQPCGRFYRLVKMICKIIDMSNR